MGRVCGGRARRWSRCTASCCGWRRRLEKFPRRQKLLLGDRLPVNLYYPGDDLFTPFERCRGAAHRQPDEPVLRQRITSTASTTSSPRCSAPRYSALRRRPGRARGVAWPPGRVPGSASAVAAPGEDARGVDVVAGDVPRVRAAARRPSPAAGVERAALPQPPARGLRDRWRAGTVTRGRKWSSGFAPGWRTRRMPTRGGCAARSSGTGGSRLAGNRPRGPDRPPAVVCCAAARGTTMPRTSGPHRACVGASRAGHDVFATSK